MHYNGLNCLMRLWLNNISMCRMWHNLDSKPPPHTCGGVFLPHLAMVQYLPATLAVNKPLLRGPVVFRYFSWPVKFLTRMIDFGRQQLLQQVNFKPNSVSLKSTTTYQQQGLIGKTNSSHISLNVKTMSMWFCLFPEEMFWSWTIVSTYQC